MNSRVFRQALTVGALVLGAATALSACDPNNATSAGAGGGSQNPSSAASAQTSATQSATQASTASQAGGGSATGTAADGGVGSGGGSNTCATGRVTVKLGGTDAGMGHRSLVLLFTNEGSSSCELSGYPGATVTDNGQTKFAPLVDAKRSLTGYMSGSQAVTTVTLAPGATASAVLEWLAAPANGDQPSAANCPGMAGGYLEITPPNTTTTTKFQPPADLCADLQVHPVVAGSSGR